MEDFVSIQGEGFQAGKPAYFIRLGGCDVGCHWCDVKESWNASLWPLTETGEIIRRASQHACKAVVVTGGEPLLYNLDPLCAGLEGLGISRYLETSGAYPLTGTWDWICVSPKKNKAVLPSLLAMTHELKVVIQTPADLSWAEENARKTNPGCHLFLQPEWSRRKQITPLIVEYIKKAPAWRLSLQIHKYIGIP
jgi:organic radical activating enzyme